MIINLQHRHFTKLLDFTPEEIRSLIALSRNFKNEKLQGIAHRHLEGKNIVLLFEKSSTRTRCAFEVAAMDLGMGVTYLDPGSSQMGKKESIEDTAKVLGRMYDGIEYRGYGQEIVEELAQYAGVPVFNGLTTEFHPTQMLADMLTIEENFPQGLKGLKLVFMGDAQNNVANSLMVVCAKLGLHFVACGPQTLMPQSSLVAECEQIATQTGATLSFTEDVQTACKSADVIYTDIWLSMGEPENLWAERIALLEPYRVTQEVMKLADQNAIFMHCLPSFHDIETTIGAQIAEKFGINEMEVEDAVFRSEQSKVFDEAENRMHTIKAVLYTFLSDATMKE